MALLHFYILWSIHFFYQITGKLLTSSHSLGMKERERGLSGLNDRQKYTTRLYCESVRCTAVGFKAEPLTREIVLNGSILWDVSRPAHLSSAACVTLTQSHSRSIQDDILCVFGCSRTSWSGLQNVVSNSLLKFVPFIMCQLFFLGGGGIDHNMNLSVCFPLVFLL